MCSYNLYNLSNKKMSIYNKKTCVYIYIYIYARRFVLKNIIVPQLGPPKQKFLALPLDPGSRWGNSSSTYSSSTCLREAWKIFGGWIKKSKGGLRVFVKGTWDSFGKISKAEEVVREERKWESSTNKRCSQKTIVRKWESHSGQWVLTRLKSVLNQ